MAAGDSLARFTPQQNEPPSTNYMTDDTRNGQFVLDADATTSEVAIFKDVMPANYAGGNLTVKVHAALTSATTGTLGFLYAFERVSPDFQDIDSDGFAADQTITAVTVPATSGFVSIYSGTATAGSATDSIAAGNGYRLKIARDTANDTATGDAELWAVELLEA